MGPGLNCTSRGRRYGVGPPRVKIPIKIQSLLLNSPCPSGRNLTQRAAAAGLKPAERGPGGGLTATYCTPWGMSKNATPPTRNAYFYVEDGAKLGSSCYLEASWGHLGGNLEVQDEAKLGQDEAKLSQVANLSHLGGDLEATWPNMAEKMPTWRQLGENLDGTRPS